MSNNDQKYMLPPNTMTVEVLNESMIGSGRRSLYPGDQVFVDPDQEPATGDFVLAELDGGRLTLRQLQRDADGDHLVPLNRDYPPTFEPFRIVGRVVGSAVLL